MKRVAASAHLPAFFEPAKRPDDRADYCLDYSFLLRWKHQVLVFTLGSGQNIEGDGKYPSGALPPVCFCQLYREGRFAD